MVTRLEGRWPLPTVAPLVERSDRDVQERRGLLDRPEPLRHRLGFGFLSKPVWEVEPWKTIAAENTPGAAPIPAPLLVVQGTGDGVVFPDVTERFVQRLCRRGDTVSLRLYPDAGHVETSSLAVTDIVAWLANRVAGKKPAPATCG